VLTIEKEDGRTTTNNRNERVVTNSDAEILDHPVENEGRRVQYWQQQCCWLVSMGWSTPRETREA
jgi:hypothetical protein